MSLRPSNHDSAPEDLELTIRFSASLADLHLSIPLSTQPDANTSVLKQLIRSHLPSDYATRRIRLIYSGKALADDARLAAILRRPPSHPPSRIGTPKPGSATAANNNSDVLSSKAKGKTPVRDAFVPAAQRIYIHCSIGDVVLTPTELAEESQLATAAATTSTTQDSNKKAQQDLKDQDATTNKDPTTPAPRGFDRLLTSGFTSTEVSALRMQFLAIQAHTHTPDDMPSPNTMRDMEDQWLDNSDAGGAANTTSALAGSAEGAPLLQSNEETEGGALDDMIYGTAMGFFWPLGCLMWAQRESGIWSARRRMAVVVGVVLNVGMGFVRFAK